MVIGYRVVAHAWKSTEVIERLGKVLLPLLDSLKEGSQQKQEICSVLLPRTVRGRRTLQTFVTSTRPRVLGAAAPNRCELNV